MHASSLDGNKGVTWKNPLLARDDGTDDDRVLTQTDGSALVLMRAPEEETEKPAAKEDPEYLFDHRDHYEMDKFWHPKVHGVTEDLYNTHHGEEPYPGPSHWNKKEKAPSAEDTRFHFNAQKLANDRIRF